MFPERRPDVSGLVSGYLRNSRPDDPVFAFNYPQCVWYAWARAKEVSGISLKFIDDTGRSAKNWLNIVAQTDGVQIVRGKNSVRANSIAVFSRGGRGNGHVVFVEKVVKSNKGIPLSVIISESNWGASKSPSTKTLSWSEFETSSDSSLMKKT